MKTLFLTFALAILTSLSFAQFPQSQVPDSSCYVANDLRVAIFMDTASFVNVKIAKVAGDVVKVRVKENDNLLYQRRIKSYELADLKYDISLFPYGAYEIEIVKNGKVVFTKTIDKIEQNQYYALP